MPHTPIFSKEALASLIMKRKLICNVELKEAFGLQDMEALNGVLKHMQKEGLIELYPVKDAWYIRAK